MCVCPSALVGWHGAVTQQVERDLRVTGTACPKILTLRSSSFWTLLESLSSVCYFKSCLWLDCSCAPLVLVQAAVELDTCWQWPHSCCFALVASSGVWRRHASGCLICFAACWNFFSLAAVTWPCLAWLSGSPAHAFNSWLLSHGWTRAAEWKWNHGDTGLRLDLTTVGDAGQRQHVLRDAWCAWCLRLHMASDRRDTQLDCFNAGGYFRRIDWHATRLFAALCWAARVLVCGATFSPAALGGRVATYPSTACIWDNCTEFGTFDHVAWECVHP